MQPMRGQLHPMVSNSISGEHAQFIEFIVLNGHQRLKGDDKLHSVHSVENVVSSAAQLPADDVAFVPHGHWTTSRCCHSHSHHLLRRCSAADRNQTALRVARLCKPPDGGASRNKTAGRFSELRLVFSPQHKTLDRIETYEHVYLS